MNAQLNVLANQLIKFFIGKLQKEKGKEESG